MDPRAAAFRKESNALPKLALTPPRPCLNLFPHFRKTIASRKGLSASLHALQTSEAAIRLCIEKDAAILDRTSYGKAAKSELDIGDDDDDEDCGILGAELKNEKWVLAGFVKAVEKSLGFLRKGRAAK